MRCASTEKMILTKAILQQARTPRGGYTREQLALIGIAWPPVKGWPMRVLGKDFPAETIEKLFARNRLHRR